MNEYLINHFESTEDLASQIYVRVLRTDFSQPGFALLKLSSIKGSYSFRAFMNELKDSISKLHIKAKGKRIGYFAASRFDQKNDTKPHRDAAPDRSFLMLGYEPSRIKSEFTVSDFTKCALEMNLSPTEFLSDFNPMYQKGLDKLLPHTTKLEEFDNSFYQLLFINNSTEIPNTDKSKWLGLLHSAKIFDDNKNSRVVNSTCLSELEEGEDETVSESDKISFLKSDLLKSY